MNEKMNGFFHGKCPWCKEYIGSDWLKNNFPVIDYPMDLKVAQVLDKTGTHVITGDPFCPFCKRHLYKEETVRYYPMEEFIDKQDQFSKRYWDELREHIKNNENKRQEHKEKHERWMKGKATEKELRPSG